MLVEIKLLLDAFLADLALREQAAAFTWKLILTIIAIGFAGLIAERATGFPDPLTNKARDWRGIWLASINGAIYGLITIGMYVWHPTHSPLNTGSDWDHVRLPWSIPFYTFGAIFLEYLLRLGALCSGFWLIFVVLLRRHFRLSVFWTLNLVVALYEIWPYLLPDVHAGRWGSIALSAALSFQRIRGLASSSLRLVHTDCVSSRLLSVLAHFVRRFSRTVFPPLNRAKSLNFQEGMGQPSTQLDKLAFQHC